MTRILLTFAVAFLSFAGASADQPPRPNITGIAYVRLYVSDMDKSRSFYAGVLGLAPSKGACAGPTRSCFWVNWGRYKQHLELEQVPSPAPKNWVAEIAFFTNDVAKMRRYLVKHSISVGAVLKDADGNRRLDLRDPEGNGIAFVERSWPIDDPPPLPPEQIGTLLIHAGFVVRDVAAENRFYRDILGFRLYWHGGFKDDGVDDWYEIQVPNGDNWIEYMLNIPASADHKELGVQNHFSLGVNDAQAAAALLRKHGLQTFDGPEVGRDGKNSLDAYDPDGTRVEVMDFAPTQKPCCHPYEAPHPIPTP